MGKKLAVVFCFFIFGCGPQLHLPAPSESLVAERRERQKEMALRLSNQRSKQIYRLAKIIEVKGADLCNKEMEPTIGILLMDRDTFPEDTRNTAARIFALTDRLQISEVVPDLPADKARLRPGDELLKIAGNPIIQTTTLFSTISKGQNARDYILKSGEQPIELEISRSGQEQRIIVNPVMACRYQVNIVNDDKVNAFTDGERIGITSGMVRFVTNDEELAIVIGHELSHIVLGHINRQKGNLLVGSILGALLDGAAAAGGLNTGGAFMRAGGNAGLLAFSQEFEREADYLGLYFAAKAGFDVSKAVDFWDRMAVEHPGSIMGNFLATHPSTPERAVSVRQTIEEIKKKIAEEKPLSPENLKTAER